MELKPIELARRKIGPGYPIFIIAEAGVNHNGSMEIACKLVDAAVEAGADAVKFQTFMADKLISQYAPKAAYQSRTTGAGESQLEMLKRLELPHEAFHNLFLYCHRKGIMFLSTPFDEKSADFLADMGMEAFKVPSGEITNLPFLAHMARKSLPMLVSTGMANLHEVESAVDTIHDTGNTAVALLHCVSNYPAEAADVNLRTMKTMEQVFGVPIGYSDHTLGIEIALAAAALGASIIEKHFTLDRNLPGPDHRASLETEELKIMVQGVRRVESALGHGRKEPVASEADTAAAARRSLVSARDIPAGTRLTAELITIKRPGTGLPPSMLSDLIGRTTRMDIKEGTLITLEMLV